MEPHNFDIEKELAPAKQLGLSSDARARIRERVAAYASAHPVATPAPSGSRAERAVPSPYMQWFFHPLPMTALASLVIVFLSGGTVFAAEGALPGDLLYPVKVGVVEPVKVALAVSPADRAAVHTELAIRRIDEAQQLAAQGALSSTTAAALNADLEAHAIAARAAAVTVAQTEPAVAASIVASLDANLVAGHDTLAEIAHEHEGDSMAFTSTDTATSSVDATSTATTSAASTGAQITSLSKRAQQLIHDNDADVSDASLKIGGSVAGTLTSHFVSNAQQKMAHATSSFAQAEKARAEGDPAAYNDYLQAITAATQAKVYAAAARHTDQATVDGTQKGAGNTDTPRQETNQTDAGRSLSTSTLPFTGKQGRFHKDGATWTAPISASSTVQQSDTSDKKSSNRDD